MSIWGRWVQEGTFLSFKPDPGKLDPCFELDTANMSVPSSIEHWVQHLDGKSWIEPIDLQDFAEAIRAIVDRRSREHLLDDSDFRYQHTSRYEGALVADWPRFLERTNQKDERAFQRYLEWHPSLLPGPYGTVHGRYHGPPFGVAFSQPLLPGVRSKRPDFLILEQDSATIYAVLIEIEAPGKHWWTRSGRPTADLTQALDQIRDWKAWFADPKNVLIFSELYDVSRQFSWSRLVQHYVLVYGRRTEANQWSELARKRHDLAGPNEFLMTYDRLKPSLAVGLTLTLDRSGPVTNFRAVSITPSFSIDYRNASWFSSLAERYEAAHANPLVEDAYREHLTRRIEAAERYAQRQSEWHDRNS